MAEVSALPGCRHRRVASEMEPAEVEQGAGASRAAKRALSCADFADIRIAHQAGDRPHCLNRLMLMAPKTTTLRMFT